MKTNLNLLLLLLFLFSCRTIQRTTETQLSESKQTVVATGQTSEMQSQESSQITLNNLSSISGSENGIEKQIEEEVIEYNFPGRDTISPGTPKSTRIVKTSRTIRERSNGKDLTFQHLTTQDSLRQIDARQTEQEFRLDEEERQTALQHRQLVRRTGVPWYVWAGGAVTITVGLWFGRKVRYNRGSPFMQNREP